jgi:predicted HTH transcriptional regulator
VSRPGCFTQDQRNPIEIFNPGKLAEGLTVDRLLSGGYSSTIRNKQIASVLKDAGIIEKLYQYRAVFRA